MQLTLENLVIIDFLRNISTDLPEEAIGPKVQLLLEGGSHAWIQKVLSEGVQPWQVCLFVCFVALRPKSTAMVIAGRSVHLTTLFSWASLIKQLTSNRAHTFACN